MPCDSEFRALPLPPSFARPARGHANTVVEVVGGGGGDMKNKWLVTEARHIAGAEKVEIKAQCNETGTSKSAMRASYDAATLP